MSATLPTLPTTNRPSTVRPHQGPAVTAGWMAHWGLRVGLAVFLLVYGWAKVFPVQMGQADFGDALVQFGEMSPMGLLWRFMAFSPTFQFLSGVAEVLAGALLLWRPTVGLGALLGALDMGFVFLLNLEYDVPVKQLALALAIGCAIVFLPYLPRYARALLGHGAVAPGPLPTAIPCRVCTGSPDGSGRLWG